MWKCYNADANRLDLTYNSLQAYRPSSVTVDNPG